MVLGFVRVCKWFACVIACWLIPSPSFRKCVVADLQVDSQMALFRREANEMGR
jgi:hypothetical protein